MGRTAGRPGFLWAMLVCFAIAALALSGVILREDAVGRAVFGLVWTALGIVWLGFYLGGFRRRVRDERDQGGAG
jgi:hypothetical protein